MSATEGENWIAPTTATTNATSEMTTRTRPRQNAKSVDTPTMPMTTTSNAVMARSGGWPLGRKRHHLADIVWRPLFGCHYLAAIICGHHLAATTPRYPA